MKATQMSRGAVEAKVRLERPLRPYLSDCVPACAVCLGCHETAACPLIEKWPGDSQRQWDRLLRGPRF